MNYYIVLDIVVYTAASSSQKGSHQETREMVTYDDDEIF